MMALTWIMELHGSEILKRCMYKKNLKFNMLLEGTLAMGQL